MDPKTQECHGLFLYGAGYFARDDNTLGMITGKGSAQENFCSQCPRRTSCETDHERRVRAQRPALVEAYDRLIKEGIRRGAPRALLKLMIGRDGQDPFASAAIENFKRGHADRGKQTGPLVQ